MHSEHSTTPCAICGKSFPRKKTYPLSAIRPNILNLIEEDHPEVDRTGRICQKDLSDYRTRYVQSMLVSEKGEITELEQEVIESIRTHDLLSMDTKPDDDSQFTFGQLLADRIAAFGGSWTFLISFFSFLAIWIAINILIFSSHPFDPYPFILLNLLLSCIAAIQAPVIMMSQNRQEQKDRIRSEGDYQINLKAELEIRHLHEKMDHLLMQQWERLVEIQQVQIELLQELKNDSSRKRDE